MKAIFGVASLLVVLAIVGLMAARQMRASGPAMAQAAALGTAPLPAASASVREQSQQLQQRVKDDVARALEQAAASRQEDAGK